METCLRYVIVCAVKEPRWHDHDHAAVREVETRTRRWTVEQVVAAIEEGHTFSTKGVRTGAMAGVGRVRCARCETDRLRSDAGATTDNNLDALPVCLQ